MIPIAKPQLGSEEQRAVQEVLQSGALIQGQRVAAFEERFAAYHGVKHGIATSNGTSALTAALMAHDIGPGDEVVVPAFTFFATASCVLSVGATPRFADIDADSFCLAAESVRSALTERTRAVVVVHLYGHPADMGRLSKLCAERGLVLIEDAAQAHGAAIGERRVGSWGTACFSFYPTKNMTTTEGGMVLTNDDAAAAKLRMVRNQGMNSQYLHEVVGYNLRMTDLCAAIGLVQLGKLPEWTQRRIENAKYYASALQRVAVPQPPREYTHVFHQYTVRLPGGCSRAGLDRDGVVKKLNEGGVGARVYYPLPIHRQPAFVALGGYERVSLPKTDEATAEVFSVPVHPALSRKDLERVATKVNELC